MNGTAEPATREGGITFTRHSGDDGRANQKSMVEEHRRKLQVAKEEVAISKLGILLPGVREALLKEALLRSDWGVDKALVLLEGFLSVHAGALKGLARRIDDRKRAVLEAHGIDTAFLERARKERRKKEKHREKEREKRKHRERKHREHRKRKDRETEEEEGERVVFDDEAERRKELQIQREREKHVRLAEAYRELQGGKAAEMREQALLKERLQVAYRTGDTDEVARLKERLNPNKE